jgi:hypothetical protein
MNELRAALWPFLDEPPADRWEAMVARVNAALEKIDDGDALCALAKEYREEAERRGKYALAHSPLYPWGVVGYLDAKADRLRYQAEKNDGPCNCALVTRLKMPQLLDSKNFVWMSEFDDEYAYWREFRCRKCGAIWQQLRCSTEQHVSWEWELIRAGDGW